MSRARALVVLVALAAALHALSFLESGPIDDDYIVYRYAHNLVEGRGLVYNAGERFEGFTVPLWTFLMAGGLALGVDPVLASRVLSVAGAAAAVLCIGLAWRRRFPDATWPLPALIVAATPAFAFHGAAGLGTTLLAALLAGWLLAWESAERAGRAPWLAGVSLALACLLRQECALFTLPFLAVELRRGRGMAALAPVLALASWTAFRLVYYGRLLPITYEVKKLPLFADLGYGLRYLGWATATCGFGVYLVLTAGAWRLGKRAAGGAVRATLVGLWLHAAYVVYVGGDFVLFARFFQPTLPLAVYLAYAGLRDRVRAPATRLTWAGVALLFPQWTQLDLAYESRAYARAQHAFNEERWIALGRHFAAIAPRGTRVALSPIGAFGWYSGLPIVDALGLVNDSAVDEVPALDTVAMKGHHRFDADWVVAQRPEVVILGNGVRDPATGRLVVNPWEAGIVRHPAFQADWVQEVLPVPGGAPLDVFRRRDAPPLPGAVPR